MAVRIAVLTMVFNEAVFLPLWIQHCGRQFGLQNLFVIDDGSTDTSTRTSPVRTVVRKKRALLDEDDRAMLVSCVHEVLLGFYDLVIYADVDEFIVIDPDNPASLAGYLRSSTFDCLAPVGVEVVHRAATESSITLDRSLFEQREFARFDRAYCKPLISKVPIRWRAGFHHCDVRYAVDCNLVLLHLRSIDRELSRGRLKTLNGIHWTDNSMRKDHGAQFRMSEARYLDLLYGPDDGELGALRWKSPRPCSRPSAGAKLAPCSASMRDGAEG